MPIVRHSFAWLSFRSRATIPSRLAISCLLLLCATSQPFLTQSAKLTLVSNHDQLRLNLSQCRNHIGETCLAHDHQIHVARRLFGTSRNRAIHERKLNPIFKRSERFVKNVSYSRRLREDAFELDENGILTIRLVIDLTATTNILDESGLAQLSQFALGRPYSCSGS